MTWWHWTMLGGLGVLIWIGLAIASAAAEAAKSLATMTQQLEDLRQLRLQADTEKIGALLDVVKQLDNPLPPRNR